MSVLVLAISASSVGAHGRDGKDRHGDALRVFTALLTGGQEVPGNDSNAFGVAFITLNEKNRGTLLLNNLYQ